MAAFERLSTVHWDNMDHLNLSLVLQAHSILTVVLISFYTPLSVVAFIQACLESCPLLVQYHSYAIVLIYYPALTELIPLWLPHERLISNFQGDPIYTWFLFYFFDVIS